MEASIGSDSFSFGGLSMGALDGQTGWLLCCSSKLSRLRTPASNPMFGTGRSLFTRFSNSPVDVCFLLCYRTEFQSI